MSQNPTSTGASPFRSVSLLPKDFSPSINEVIVGRGKKVTNAPGNRRFRDLINSKIDDYLNAENKSIKSSIIFDVLQEVKEWSPATGGFVKQDSKTQRWFSVEESTARNTAAQAFRDASSGSYKSSKKSKQQRRLHRKLTASPTGEEASEGFPSTITTSGDMEALPVMPALDTDFSAIPRQVSLCLDTASPSHLEGILDSALGMSLDDELSVGPSFDQPQQLDLEALWDVLRVPSLTENPFEPTPIAPASSTLPAVPLLPSLEAFQEQSKSNYPLDATLSLQWAMSCRR